ncbi:trimeric LpxA-like protein [Chaetomium sp. MPI-SDFR-AT-0129]|nr:trimeric LpxA-like protein [Chaetomium sp. MPI-SDFR-AT-0129]
MSSESTITSVRDESELVHYPDVIFPAGNPDFRAGRNRCAKACREFNNTPDDADPEQRSQRWLDIVRPNRDRANDSSLAVTHDQTFANPTLKAKTPFVKPPIFIDYGVRLQVGGSTFINRNCMIMDTPVADIVIGEGCNIGANCCIIGVTHPVRLDERLERNSIGQPVTIGDNVWIGANVTILGGVTIGDGGLKRLPSSLLPSLC